MKLSLGIIFLLLFLSLIFNTSAFARDDNDNSGKNGEKKVSQDENKDKEDEKRQEIKVESKDGQTRVEVREKSDKDGTRFKQEIRTPTGKIKFELEDGKAKIKVKTNRGEEEFKVASPSSQTQELANIESSEKNEVKIKIRGDRFELKAKGATALTNFPLTLNPETNELSVTTPGGTVFIKTLPLQAVKNILASNVMDRVLGQNINEDETDEDKDQQEKKEGEAKVKAEGLVESITDTQILVSGVTFAINKSTKFEGLVSVGSGVKVKGIPQNGVLVAQKVELENEIEPRVKIEGVVESVNGNSIVVGGITFNISDATKIEGILRPGQTVELKSQISTNGALLANKIAVEAPGEGVVLAEEKGKAVFKIKGQKDARFLNIFPVTLPIEANVSVETGQVLSVSRPLLLNIFGFLFRT